MFEIEKGHDVPDNKPAVGPGSLRYPFKEMVPGDSFLVTDTKTFGNVRCSVNQYAKRHKINLFARSTDEGLRVYRGEDD